jgi:hypothetical protein
MVEPFKLITEKYSEKDNEWQWTYLINFNLIFSEQKITEITITDYTWTKKGREAITKELILSIFKEVINGKEIEPEAKKNPNWKRDHFVPKRIPYRGKKYKLVFWFKDGTDNHLWIKNCHRQD